MIPQLKKGMALPHVLQLWADRPPSGVPQASNDNLGVDVGRYAGAVVIHRVPLQRIPALEMTRPHPIYGWATGSTKLARLKDWWNKPTHIDKVPDTTPSARITGTSLISFMPRTAATPSLGATGRPSQARFSGTERDKQLPAAMNALPLFETDERQIDLYLPDRTPKQDMRSKLIRSKEALGERTSSRPARSAPRPVAGTLDDGRARLLQAFVGVHPFPNDPGTVRPDQGPGE